MTKIQSSKIIPYQTKTKRLSGTSYTEVKREAQVIFNEIKRKTKRQPYIRSAYFNKQKIFFNYFWNHLLEKNFKERTRRVKYFNCAIDLIKNSKVAPTSKENVNNKNEILHRFMGQMKDKTIFFVQIKEDKKTNKKYFISCFPLR